MSADIIPLRPRSEVGRHISIPRDTVSADLQTIEVAIADDVPHGKLLVGLHSVGLTATLDWRLNRLVITKL